jgi:hypothetical protein
MDLSDIPRIKGPLRLVAYIGVLIMMGGLAVFAFGLLSMIGSFDRENIPSGFPPYAIYGFGVAAFGGILVTIALAIGPKESEYNMYGDVIHGDVIRDVNGNVITRPSGPVDARYYVINQQRTYVGQIDVAVRSLPLPQPIRRNAEAAIDDVEQAVEKQNPREIANALVRLTSILNEAGALATSADAASRAIVGLAQTLGGYGQSLVQWFSAF